MQFQQSATQTATAPKDKTLYPNKSRVSGSGSFGASSNNRTTPFLYCRLKQNIGEPRTHVDRCLARGNRPLGSGYEAWSGHSKTLRPKSNLRVKQRFLEMINPSHNIKFSKSLYLKRVAHESQGFINVWPSTS